MYDSFISLLGVDFSSSPVEFLVLSAFLLVGISFALDLFVSLFAYVFRS